MPDLRIARRVNGFSRERILTAFRLAPFAVVAALALRPGPVPAQTTQRTEKPEAFAEYEDKSIQLVVERQSRHSDTDRGRWLMELNRVYPGRCAVGRTKADFDQWFELLAEGRTDWRKDSAPNRAVRDLFDRVTQKLELGPVPSIRKEEFLQFANAVLRPDKNGAVRIQEQFTEADKMFRILDRDGNGMIEETEMTERMRAVIKEEPDGQSGFDRDRYRVYFQGRVAAAVELVTLPTRSGNNGQPGPEAGKGEKTADR